MRIPDTITSLQELLLSNTDIELAVLIGSRATGNINKNSDWDIALQWKKTIPAMKLLAKTEKIRAEISILLAVASNKIDLIDIPTSRITMKAVVAEEGILLKGDNSLAWSHFLQRTWRELEDIDFRGQIDAT